MANKIMSAAAKVNANKIKFVLLNVAIMLLFNSCQQSKSNEAKLTSADSADAMDRTMLPIKEPFRQTYKELDALMQRPRHVLT